MNPGLFDRIISIGMYTETNNNGSLEAGYTNIYKDIRARLMTKSAVTSMKAGVGQNDVSVEWLVNSKDAPEIKGFYILTNGTTQYRINGAFDTPEYGRGRYTKIIATQIVT